MPTTSSSASQHTTSWPVPALEHHPTHPVPHLQADCFILGPRTTGYKRTIQLDLAALGLGKVRRVCQGGGGDRRGVTPMQCT
jgi:hypothetical protein